MAKFVYRMDNILNLYVKLEGEAKIELTMANNALREEEDKLQKIYDDIEAYKDSIREINSGKLDIMELKRCNDAIAVKKMEAEEQKKEIEKARHMVERARKKLTDIMKDRKTQEVLREKAFDEFKREMEEAENKEVDQIVSYNFRPSENTQ